MTQDATYWNGERCTARRCRVLVADAPEFPRYWARLEGIVGQSRAAVEVSNANQAGPQPFFLDDEDGSGWTKVTEGRGGPGYPHRSLAVKRVLEYVDEPIREPGRAGVDAGGTM